MTDDPHAPVGGQCQCCDRWVARIHWMEWDNDLSWLCDECAEGAIEEAEVHEAEAQAERDNREDYRDE